MHDGPCVPLDSVWVFEGIRCVAWRVCCVESVVRECDDERGRQTYDTIPYVRRVTARSSGEPECDNDSDGHDNQFLDN